MPPAKIPKNEASRLQELYALELLDTASDPNYDDLVKLLAEICQAPMAAVSLVDTSRQWFKASVGLDVKETPRDHAFCAYTILKSDPLVITDALSDARFSDNPLVIQKPKIRFYAGLPLTSSLGAHVGTLCVLDTKPRNLSNSQMKSLEILARQVGNLFQLRRTNLRLRKALFRVNSIVENLHGGIIVEDESGRSIVCNQALAKVFQGTLAKRQNLLGVSRNAIVQELAPNLSDPESFLRRIEEITRAKQPILSEKLYLSNGSVLERDYVPMSDSSESNEHLWFYRDVTAYHQNERILQFQRSRMQALGKLSTVGIMAGGIAHEINNPLTIIYGRANALLTAIKDPKITNEEKKAQLLGIKENVIRISKIIKALRVFSGNESNTIPQEFGIPGLVENIKHMTKSRIHNHSIDFQVNLSHENLSLIAKEIQVSQVLINLINNAIDAIKHQSDRWIRLEIMEQGGEIRFNVLDSGPGIEESIRKNLMVPFFTTKEIGKGTGLGLALCKGFVEQMGGVFFLDESKSNTCFSMSLPKSKANRTSQPNLLVVDDEKEIRDLVKEKFLANGWTVFEAGSVEKAIDLLSRNRIDTIISDVRMSGRTGLELLEYIQLGSFRELPVFLISAYSDIQRHDAIERGAKDLFEKPFDTQEVFRNINNCLKRNFIRKPGEVFS